MAEPKANNDAGGPCTHVSGSDEQPTDEQLESIARLLLSLASQTPRTEESNGNEIEATPG